MKALLDNVGATDLTGLPRDNKILYEAIMKCDYTKTKQVANIMYHKLV